MERDAENEGRHVVGGVDTHKDLHVAAVVDEQDRVLASRCFPTTRHGYKQMLAWMRSFGLLQRVGVEATGTYGAGLLRYLQRAGVKVLEVTAPDTQDRRRRGKNDDLDAQNAAHAAFAGSAYRHAEKPQWHDRVPACAQGLPQDGRGRAPRRLADDPQHHRLARPTSCGRRCAG